MESSRKPRDGLVSKRRPIDFFRTPWGGWFSSGEPTSGRILDEVLLLKRRPIDFFRTPWGGWGPGAYLDLALIFLLLRFSLRIRFLRHLARIVPAFGVVNSSKPLERKAAPSGSAVLGGSSYCWEF